MISLIVRIMKHWDKFHADWIKFEKSGFHEQAQKNLTLEGGQDTDQADKDKASSKRKRREEASRKEQHKHPKLDTSVPTAKGGKCDGCGNKPDKQSKPCLPKRCSLWHHPDANRAKGVCSLGMTRQVVKPTPKLLKTQRPESNTGSKRTKSSATESLLTIR